MTVRQAFQPDASKVRRGPSDSALFGEGLPTPPRPDRRFPSPRFPKPRSATPRREAQRPQRSVPLRPPGGRARTASRYNDSCLRCSFLQFVALWNGLCLKEQLWEASPTPRFAISQHIVMHDKASGSETPPTRIVGQSPVEWTVSRMFNPVEGNVNFPEQELAMGQFWKEQRIYEKSLEQRAGAPPFVFYEGPPTANGMPHPGHCLTRAIKDLFPRYRTMRGYRCERKAGWDTHGLPVEVEVCKELGIHSQRRNRSLRHRTLHPEVPTKRVALHEGMGAADRAHRLLGRSQKRLCHLPPKLRRKRLVEPQKPVRPRAALPRPQNRLVVGPRRHGTLQRRSWRRVSVGGGSERVCEVSAARRRLAKPTDTSLLVWTTTPWTLPAINLSQFTQNIDYSVVGTDARWQNDSDLIVATDARRNVAAKEQSRNYSKSIKHTAKRL